MFIPHFLGSGSPSEEVIESRDNGGGAGSWPSKQDYRNKRKHQAILDDDAELMHIIQAALPAMIKYLRR